MGDEIAYMLGVVAAGLAVNFGLRALPFVLFGRKGRSLPKAVEKLGAVISPVIIACLIVYSYASLEWRTAAPMWRALSPSRSSSGKRTRFSPSSRARSSIWRSCAFEIYPIDFRRSNMV